MPIGDNYNQLSSTAYASKGKLAVITPSVGKALKFASISYGSSVSGNIKAAVLERLHNDAWKAGQYNAVADTATAVLDLTADITLTSVALGAARNGTTFTIQVAAAAANPTNTILFNFSGTPANIVVTCTPNDGTNNAATPVTITTANLKDLITTGLIGGKVPTITDSQSLRILQTATGGDATALADGGEGDGVGATFSGGQSIGYQDDTTDAQDAGTGDFPLFSLVNNDGFSVQAITQFNFLCIPVSTAEAGSPVYSYQYWNGSAYATLPVIESATAFTVTDNYVVFHAPIDWAKGGPDGEGYDADKYHIRVRATTAPSTAALATEIIVGKFIDYTEALAEFGIVNLDYNCNAYKALGGSGLMAYFSTADAANFIEATFREV